MASDNLRRQMAADAGAQHTGQLEKWGGGGLLHGSSWKQRFFVMEDGKLSYYDRMEGASGSIGALKGSFELRGAIIWVLQHGNVDANYLWPIMVIKPSDDAKVVATEAEDGTLQRQPSSKALRTYIVRGSWRTADKEDKAKRLTEEDEAKAKRQESDELLVWCRKLQPVARPTWEPDGSVTKCGHCDTKLGGLSALVCGGSANHHCRHCGKLMCGQCTNERLRIPHLGYTDPVRVCKVCVGTVRSLQEDGLATFCGGQAKDQKIRQ